MSRYDQLKARCEQDPSFVPTMFRKHIYFRGRLVESVTMKPQETFGMTPYELMKLTETIGVF